MYKLYTTLLPCLFFLLNALLTAQNDYERWHHTEKQGKENMARQVCFRQATMVRQADHFQAVLVIISILLYKRNRATDAFQLVSGIFLASSGGSRRIIDVLHAMGISVSYEWVYDLNTLSESS